MITKEEWNNIYFTALPLVGIVVSALGVTVGLLALKRSQAEAVGIGSLETIGYAPIGVNIPKVHYEDSQVLVQVRNPGEWHDIRDFVQPTSPEVISTISRALYDGGDDIAFKLLDYVCKSVSYHSDDGEWWEFPNETIRQGFADCEGSSILLCSLLRNFYPPDRVYVVAGTYRSLGHAWVELDREILEPTYTYAHPVPDPWNYKKLVAWNDQEVLEMWPGAMSGLFQLAWNECQKLILMAEANE